MNLIHSKKMTYFDLIETLLFFREITFYKIRQLPYTFE